MFWRVAFPLASFGAIASLSSERNVVNKSSALTMNRFHCGVVSILGPKIGPYRIGPDHRFPDQTLQRGWLRSNRSIDITTIKRACRESSDVPTKPLPVCEIAK